MTPADLDAIVRDALREASYCNECGHPATRICHGCASTWCDSHNGDDPHAPQCDEGMAPLHISPRLAMARALREAWQERDAALAAADAVRADYAPRREPPTADEVRALAGLWGKHVALGGDAACLVFTENVRPHGVGPVPSMLWVTVSMADVVVCDDDGCDALSARMVGGEDAEYVWQALRPEGGALPWSELAALVRGGDRG